MSNRILHVVGRMDRAGAETMIMNLYREMDRTQYQFDFAYFTTDRCDYDDEIESLGGRIIYIKGNNSVHRFWSLYKALRSHRWSIVQSHMLFNIGLNLLAAKLAGVPSRIAHSHSTKDDNSSSMIGRIYQSLMRCLIAKVPTSYVACGESAADYLYPDRQDVKIIPNAVDINRFALAASKDARRDLNLPNESLIILQVGRLMPVKNHLWSVKVALALYKSGLDFRMLFVGEGPEHGQIQAQIERLGLGEYVQLLGLRQDIPELMAAADVMLMPSYHEGFPVVLVESQAAGLPAVISSSIPAEVDLVLDLIDFVALDDSAENWAKQILIADRKPKVELSVCKVALESYGFSSQSGAKLLKELYESL